MWQKAEYDLIGGHKPRLPVEDELYVSIVKEISSFNSLTYVGDQKKINFDLFN